jgi:predicted nuclease with TOPRIM domain
LETKSIEVQLLKFGQVINLESLEQKTVNKRAEELKDKMKKENTDRMKDLEELDVEIKNIKKQFAIATIENTDLLQQLATLSRSQYQLEAQLDLSQNTMVKNKSRMLFLIIVRLPSIQVHKEENSYRKRNY